MQIRGDQVHLPTVAPASARAAPSRDTAASPRDSGSVPARRVDLSKASSANADDHKHAAKLTTLANGAANREASDPQSADSVNSRPRPDVVDFSF